MTRANKSGEEEKAGTGLTIAGYKVLVCDCEGTMKIDGARLAKALGSAEKPTVFSHLCRAQADSFTSAVNDGEPLLVACTQEAPLFRELGEDTRSDTQLAFTNIRERAGWCKAPAKALPKMAALLAEAALETRPAGTITLLSRGVCLVYGSGQAALDAARELAGRLNVSLLLETPGDAMPPALSDVPVHTGRIAGVQGHFGAFSVTVDGYAPLVPSSRSGLEFVMARDGATSRCDLIFDMSGGDPLVPAAAHREGYFHVDPDRPAEIARAMFQISDLVGEFDKPIYVRHDPAICAHSRNQQAGCNKCLDLCPASAITSAGDVVAIEAAVCGGCGFCSSVCPTGAAAYDYPGREDLVRRIQVLARTYREAGGRRPVLLLHDERRGADMICALARFGQGLPDNVIPLSVNEIGQTGHDVLAGALASGFGQILVLAHPSQRDGLSGLAAEIALVNQFMGALGHDGDPRVRLLIEDDPEQVEQALNGSGRRKALKPGVFTPPAGKRELARLAFAHLNKTAPATAEIVALPDGAPYGRIHIDQEGCTLCLACVATCPANALQDNPDAPEVRFVEQACVQCGICRTTCPESAIALEPRYNFTAEAMAPVVLHEEEPYSCIRCGREFGTRSSVERVIEKLSGKHWMFQKKDTTDLIRMCDDCRIMAQAEMGNDPFAAAPRPRPRTTEDYLSSKDPEQDGKPAALTPDDFLKEK